jgi:hypothetical protein
VDVGVTIIWQNPETQNPEKLCDVWDFFSGISRKSVGSSEGH